MRFDITDINNQDLSNFLRKSKNLPDIGYKKKQIRNEPTESYLFLIRNITKLIKIKKCVRLCIKEVK